MPRGKKERANGTGSIYKRLGSSFWQMAYRVNGNVEQESTGCTNKKQAQDKLKQRLAEVQTGAFNGSQFERTMVAELIEDVFRDYRINGHRSLDDTETRWNLHLKPVFGMMKARDVGKDAIRKDVDQRNRRALQTPASTRSSHC
jgi:hypothetical protein